MIPGNIVFPLPREYDIHIAFHDGIKHLLVNTSRLHTSKFWIEESLGALEALAADHDNLAVWEARSSCRYWCQTWLFSARFQSP